MNGASASAAAAKDAWERSGAAALEQAQRLPWSGVPDRYRGGLSRWIAWGVPPGDFLCAVLRNDLAAAVFRADEAGDGMGGGSGSQIRPILLFLRQHAPIGCFGSAQAFEAWRDAGGVQGLAAERLARIGPGPSSAGGDR